MSAKVLIADDEPNILISLEYLMKREGYVVSVARDGQEALEVGAACDHGPASRRVGEASRSMVRKVVLR